MNKSIIQCIVDLRKAQDNSKVYDIDTLQVKGLDTNEYKDLRYLVIDSYSVFNCAGTDNLMIRFDVGYRTYYYDSKLNQFGTTWDLFRAQDEKKEEQLLFTSMWLTFLKKCLHCKSDSIQIYSDAYICNTCRKEYSLEDIIRLQSFMSQVDIKNCVTDFNITQDDYNKVLKGDKEKPYFIDTQFTGKPKGKITFDKRLTDKNYTALKILEPEKDEEGNFNGWTCPFCEREHNEMYTGTCLYCKKGGNNDD